MIAITLILIITILVFYFRTIPIKREFSCKFYKDAQYNDDRYVDLGSHVPAKFKDFYSGFGDNVNEVILGKDEGKFYVVDKEGYIHCTTDDGKISKYVPKTLKCKGIFAETFNKERVGAYMDSDGSVHINLKDDNLKIGENSDKIIRILDAYKCNKDGIDNWFEKYKDYTISWLALNKGSVTVYYR